MDVKVFEIRDRMTLIPALAIRLSGSDSPLLWRAGFGREVPYVILTRFHPMESQYDPYSWEGNARTMPRAHQYVIDNWDQLANGAVIDVEFIQGESSTPKLSEVSG